VIHTANLNKAAFALLNPYQPIASGPGRSRHGLLANFLTWLQADRPNHHERPVKTMSDRRVNAFFDAHDSKRNFFKWFP